MKIRLLKSWRIWSKGHIIPEMQPNEANELIRRGIAEEVADLRDVDVPRRRTRGGMRAGQDYETR